MSNFLNEFKAFAMRGNVLDLAVGVIIGGAFGKIVSSLVDNILMPIIGTLTGGVDFSGLAITVGSAQIKYGMFIQNPQHQNQVQKNVYSPKSAIF